MHLNDISVKARWRSLERSYRIIYIMLGVVVLLAGFTAISIITTVKPAERMTEFYLLGPEGRAESYPGEGVAGQALTVTLGIHNLEGIAATYGVEVHDGQGLIGQAGPLQVDDSVTYENALSFTPRQTGDNVEVTFLLFRDHQAAPYRTLRLYLNVRPAP